MKNPLLLFIQRIIRQKGVSARGLAFELGLNHTTVSRWLSGKERPSPASCKKLADYAGARAEWVLSLAGYLPFITETSASTWPAFGEYARLKYTDELGEDFIDMIEDLIERRRRKREQSSESVTEPS